jgi:glucan biosynthesis protein C
MDRVKRIGVPLFVGWIVLIPLILMLNPIALVMSFGPEGLKTPMAKIPEFTPHMFPFIHLWFLYLLCALYVGAMAIRWVADKSGFGPRLGELADRIVKPLATSPAGVVALGLPAAIGLFILPYPVLWNGVPPPALGFFPSPISLVVYGLAFGFGWGLQRHGQLIRSMQKYWALHLALAIALTWMCLLMVGTTPTTAPVLEGAERAVWTLAYGIAGWAWSFALIGMALRFMSSFSPRLRYLADASYWIYLVHMPVVIMAQALVCHIPLPWFIKFPLMMGVVIPLLLLSYHLCVRYTIIGEYLNGKRATRPTRKAAEPELAPGVEQPK